MLTLKQLIGLSKYNEFNDLPNEEDPTYLAIRKIRIVINSNAEIISEQIEKWKVSPFDTMREAKARYKRIAARNECKMNFKIKKIELEDEDFEIHCEFINICCITKNKLFGKVNNYDIERIKKFF